MYSTVQNDILKCALEVYRKKVVSQVEQALLIALIADEKLMSCAKSVVYKS